MIQESGFEVFKHILLLEAYEKGANFCFLQIGGHDGITFDPIRNFARKFGWQGVILEPQPNVFERLRKNYEACPNVRLVNAAAGDEDGRRPLFKFAEGAEIPEHASMLASFNREALEHNGHGYDYPIEEIDVTTISIETLFIDYCGGKVDFLQVDTEGYDYYIIKQLLRLDPEMMPSLIRFENYMPANLLHELLNELTACGYRTQAIEEHGAVDIIATRRDMSEFADRSVEVRLKSPSKLERDDVLKAEFHVILLCYNDLPHCKKALDSVIAQTDGRFRLTIVDNGSTDATCRLAERYTKDPRVDLVSMRRNQRSDAAQHIAETSQSEYISFLFADDYYHPRRLEEARKELAAFPEAGFLFFNNRYIDDDGAPVKTIPITQFSGDISSMDRFQHIHHFLYNGNSLHPCGMIIRTNVYKELGGFPKMMHRIGDMTFFVRLLGAYDGLFLPQRMQSITVWNQGRNESHGNYLLTNQLMYERTMFLERYLEPAILENLEKIFETRQSESIVLYSRPERLWYLAHHIMKVLGAPDYQIFGHRLLYQAAMESNPAFEEAILKSTGLTVSEYVTELSGKSKIDFAMFGRAERDMEVNIRNALNETGNSMRNALSETSNTLNAAMSRVAERQDDLESGLNELKWRIANEERFDETFLSGLLPIEVQSEMGKFLLSIGMKRLGRRLYDRAERLRQREKLTHQARP